MQSLKNLILIIVFILYCSCNSFSQENKTKNVIVIPKGQSRSFILTNNNAAFFFSETGNANTSAFQGLNVQTHEFLEDYAIEINGRVLKRETADAYLYPNKLIRKYDNLDFKEEITLLDSLPVLVIKLTSSKKLQLALIPFISGASQSKNFITYWTEEDRLLYIAKKKHIVRSKDENYPVWTGVCTHPHAEFLDLDSDLQRAYVGLKKKDRFLPGKLNFLLDGTAYIFFIIGDNKNDVLQKRKQVLRKFNIFIEKSSKKIDGVRKT